MRLYSNVNNILTNCTRTAHLKQKIEIHSFVICLEPGAGQGAFYKLMPNKIHDRVDLDPKYPGVVQMNFFDYKPR
jgi:hypothetical protein